jgi:hypothetical protein
MLYVIPEALLKMSPHTTGTIHAEQKQPYDKYHIAHNT